MRNHQVATQIKSPTLKQPNIYVTSHRLQNLILTYLQKQHSAPVFLPFVWVVLQGQLAICFSYLWKFHAENFTVMHWLEQTESILRQHFGPDTFLHLMIGQTQMMIPGADALMLPHAKRTKNTQLLLFCCSKLTNKCKGVKPHGCC